MISRAIKLKRIKTLYEEDLLWRIITSELEDNKNNNNAMQYKVVGQLGLRTCQQWDKITIDGTAAPQHHTLDKLISSGALFRDQF